MMKKEDLQDLYLDELLREESQGKKNDESLIDAIVKAVDEEREQNEEVTPKATSRAPWAWAAMFIAAGVGGVSYLSTKGGSVSETVLTNQAEETHLRLDSSLVVAREPQVTVGKSVLDASVDEGAQNPFDKYAKIDWPEQKTELAQLGDLHDVANVKSKFPIQTNPALPPAPSTRVRYGIRLPEEQSPSDLALLKAPQPEMDAFSSTRGVSLGRRAVNQSLAVLDSADEEARFRMPQLHPSPGSPEGGSERYGELTDQAWISPLDEPLSTFSVDVDTASYANVRRMLNDGQEVPVDAVRVEEFINYFDYNYAGPEDDKPFATHLDLANCPWDEDHLLLKVGLKGKEVPHHNRPASNLVFLIDVSGSMQNSDKLPLVVESMKILVEELDERDRVGIVVYAGAEGVVLNPTNITDDGRGFLLEALNKLRAGGSTNGGAGIKRAYEMAQKHFVKEGVNRVILCTDGDFNVGTTGQDDLVKLVKKRAQGGVFLSVLGFGTGNINDSMLEAITNDGNGNYFYIDTIREGRKVFLQDLSGTLVTIAKDVKLQLEFNPHKIANYRLIGYANRRLRKEDFNNDKVDAGDIGAGHTVTALYEIVPVGSESPIRAEVDSLRYKAEAKKAETVVPKEVSAEWLNVKLRFKQPGEDVSTKMELPLEGEPVSWKDAGADFQMAAGVALFGMKLRDSQYIGDADWSLAKTLAENGLGNDIHEHRAEFLKVLEKVKGE